MRKIAATAAGLLILIGTARAMDAPNMKEGLWKLHTITTNAGAKPEEATYSLCRNHAYDKQGYDLAMKQTGCTFTDGPVSGNKRTFSSTCKVGGSTLTSHSTLTTVGDTSFRTETSTTYTPAFYGQTQVNTVQEQTYIGACPSGMQPGDIITADGKIQHRGTH